MSFIVSIVDLLASVRARQAALAAKPTGEKPPAPNAAATAESVTRRAPRRFAPPIRRHFAGARLLQCTLRVRNGAPAVRRRTTHTRAIAAPTSRAF
ncbi:hypothetical protein AQ725_18980 [Burkholderia pseudomallei]|nr:hypothetical protein AQ725_18980 [Burkholderia pseudomallei]